MKSTGRRWALVAAAMLAIGAVALYAKPPAAQAVPPASAAGTVAPAPSPPTFDLDRALEAARETVQRFRDRLKLELQTAIKADGLANAVSVCQTISPEISLGIADVAGFEVTRTSTKLRNPESKPDAWEREVLEVFQAKVASGADPDKLEHHAEVTTPEGDRLLRYMRGIAVGEMCLACHGTDIRPDVKAELVRYYPDDKATGYRLGELRGAFSLVKSISD